MIKLISLALLPLIAVAQQSITVPITVEGTTYQVSFAPGTVTLDAVAGQFCVRNAAAFGITRDDQLPNCITPVMQYLQAAVPPSAPPKTQPTPAMKKVSLTVGGTDYNMEYPVGTSSAVVAQQFCIQNAASLGLTTNDQLPGCVAPIAEYLEKQSATAKPSVATIPITVGGKQFNIEYNPAGQETIQQVSRNFCVRNAASFGIVTTDQLPGCVDPVVDYLVALVNRPAPAAPKEITIPITVEGTTYQVSFAPGTVTLDAVAGQFCVRNAAAFGITRDDQLPNCITPVMQYLQAAVSPNAPQPTPAMKQVPLTVGGVKYNLEYPSNVSIDTVAREFCVRNAAAVGITTNEQLPGCVGPVVDYLKTV